MRTALIIAALAAASAAFGQKVEPIAPHRGVFSVGLRFDATFIGGAHETIFHVTPAYFVTDHLELRVPLAFDQLPGTRETAYGIGVRWHFGHRGSLVDPFVGVEREHAIATHFREDLSAAQIGFHFFVANNVALTTALTIGRDDTNGNTVTTYHLVEGLTIFFRD
jgi:hypothetical protein